jgi:hypothetical protein
MDKTAFQMGVEDALEYYMEKEALAVTDEGHKLDAGRARAARDYHSNARKSEREFAVKAPVRGSMRGFQEAAHRSAERHQDYKARKHEDKRNAFNPFGGVLTKSRSEKD